MIIRRKLVYIQVFPGYILAKLPKTADSVRKECSALKHPRTLMGDFFEVEQCLAQVLAELKSKYKIFLKPRCLVHLMPKLEGGYTNVELRAFREAAEGAGFHGVLLLTDHDSLVDADFEELSIQLNTADIR